MRITTIRWSYGLTVNLGDYSNVRPELSMEVVLEEGDNPAACERNLHNQIMALIHEEADRALERAGRLTLYDTSPKFQVLRSNWDGGWDHENRASWPKVIVILPDSYDERVPGYIHALYPQSCHLRYSYALQKATEKARETNAILIDCSDGDLSKIIPMPPEDSNDPDRR